jgi:FTO catalytic domain
LINRCYPINGEVKMKLEPTFQKEKCTVSWHADSTLEHYSSIAVYHCTKAPKTKKNPSAKNDPEDASWRISLRVCPNAEGPKAGKLKNLDVVEEPELTAPPLAVPLPTKWSYYLLDDFNHHHQHSGVVLPTSIVYYELQSFECCCFYSEKPLSR